MKIIINKIIIVLFLLSFITCNEKDEPDTSISVVKIDAQEKNEFDIFLEREFVEPYNISFLYKFSDIERDFNFALVPAIYENSIKMANLVKYLCLEPYAKVAPPDFLKRFFPKQLMMVGSAAYQNNGTRVIGTAEGGLKITLYEINNLDTSDAETLKRLYFRTIYHEFSHVLHQNIDYTIDFDNIALTEYVGDEWNENWGGANGTSLAAGFISDYSSKEPNEDFVELLSFYITNTEIEWNEIISNAGDNGGPIIQQKLEIVKNYFDTVWSIDLDELRDEIQFRISNLSSIDLDNIN
jgi:substrate import-associated zinc metallohydrolase lipoprotein